MNKYFEVTAYGLYNVVEFVKNSKDNCLCYNTMRTAGQQPYLLAYYYFPQFKSFTSIIPLIYMEKNDIVKDMTIGLYCHKHENALALMKYMDKYLVTKELQPSGVGF